MAFSDEKLRSKTLVTDDGMALIHRVVPAENPVGVAFLAHGQAQHSLNMLPTAQNLSAHGWDVHMTDLRGHGGSAGARAPLAHMTIGSGWEKLVSDMRHALEHAFAGVPRDDRLVIAPNIGAPLVLEVLKTWPDLARHIVLAAPPPNQPALLKIARGVTRARSFMHPHDAPDEMLLHHLFSFLGAQADGCERLVDVVSSDRRITDMLLNDPLAWPTPTTGYFCELFRGIDSAWKSRKPIAAGTRILILYGSDDPMTARGGYVSTMRDHFAGLGVSEVSAQCVDGGRCGLIIEEERLCISDRIAAWAGGAMPNPKARHSAAPDPATRADAVSRISFDTMSRLGMAQSIADLSAEEIVDLCYSAIDDENRWAAILHRLVYELTQEDAPNDARLETMLMDAMPHWQRSYEINRQLMQSAALGAVFGDILDRFHLGIAVVNDSFEVSFANALFARRLGELTETDLTGASQFTLTRALAGLLPHGFSGRGRSVRDETVFRLKGNAIGLHLRPRALFQSALMRGGASGVLVLRCADDRPDAPRTGLGQLLQLAYGLTEREAETALRAMDGMASDQIAQATGVSIHTTRTHLKHIYEKMGVETKTELVTRLLRGPIGLIANG